MANFLISYSVISLCFVTYVPLAALTLVNRAISNLLCHIFSSHVYVIVNYDRSVIVTTYAVAMDSIKPLIFYSIERHKLAMLVLISSIFIASTIDRIFTVREEAMGERVA